MLNDNEEYVITKKRNCFTVLFSNAPAKCCAPLSPILLHARSRNVSVYMSNHYGEYEIDSLINYLTLLVRNVLAKYSVP